MSYEIRIREGAQVVAKAHVLDWAIFRARELSKANNGTPLYVFEVGEKEPRAYAWLGVAKWVKSCATGAVEDGPCEI
jgi:hypothetical protein